MTDQLLQHLSPDVRMTHTRYGLMVYPANDMFIGPCLEAYGEYGGAEWQLLAQVVKPGMTVVEMGANMGTHSIPLARACFPGPLYLFEPQQRIFQILCANLALNGVGNAIAYPEACAAEHGELTVPAVDYHAENNFGGVALVRPQGAGVQGLKVRAVPLDSLDLPACHLLKIDVEGFEADVLRGAEGLIRKCRPLIYIENDRAAHQQEIISLIAGMDYRLFWHIAPLFSADNVNGVAENVFGQVASINMLCVPAERKTQVREMVPIDPDNWTCPARVNL